MFSEIDTDDRQTAERFLLDQLKEGTNVRLTVRSKAGRYSAAVLSVGDEPDLASRPTA